MKLNEHDLVKVTWDDSVVFGNEGWTFSAELGHTAMRCETLGWLVDDKGDAITVLSTIADAPEDSLVRYTDCLSGVVIPKGAVRKIEYLSVANAVTGWE